MIKEDKILHFLVGLVLTIGLTLAFNHAILTSIVVILVAFAKEVYDEATYGGFDIYDILATVAPLTLLIIL